ncbi:hypothetical protein BH20ACT21_BH20ACT21_09720 [soil metagenome]|nr:hypothetical protein [Actinomycetota bacterium]
MSSLTAGLLVEAHGLLAYSDAATAGLWPRAAALLARQALEQGLNDFWQVRAPGVEKGTRRSQMLCLRSYADEQLAEEANHTWTALSRACHHHAYELSPTASELKRWMRSVTDVVDSLETNGGKRRSPA